jgi:hypothetical protein
MPAQATSGPVNAVPCPHCGKPNDLSPHAEEEQHLDTGNEFDCDHCHRLMQVTAIKQVTVVSVRQSMRPGGRPVQPPPTAGGFMKRLIGGR